MITLVPIPDDPVEAGYGLLAGEGLSLVEALLQERQWEREKEAAGMVKVLWSGA
ncbi:MAG TPA: hypothetical protein G4O05_04795 [Caldilineae bacterium]|nr:hypothetical protein [Caldilineae bacterium]